MKRVVSLVCRASRRAAALVSALASLLFFQHPCLAQTSIFSLVPGKDAEIVAFIADCLAHGKEVVLLPASPECKEYREGINSLPPAHTVRAEDVCNGESNDLRRVARRGIKAIFNRIGKEIDPKGLRLLGGVYCDGVDLIGLELPYSIVLDGSVVIGSIDARTFKTANDFSIDRSAVYPTDRACDGDPRNKCGGSLNLVRAQIGGSLFASNALLRYVNVADTRISGSFTLTDSVVVDGVFLDNLTIDGDLDLNGNHLSYLLGQELKVAAQMQLSQSRARCAFHLRNSDVGSLVALDARLGANGSDDAQFISYRGNEDPLDKYVQPGAAAREMLGSRKACNLAGWGDPASFQIVDIHVRHSVCIMDASDQSNPEAVTRHGKMRIQDMNVDSTFAFRAGPFPSPPFGLSIWNLRANALMLDFDQLVKLQRLSRQHAGKTFPKHTTEFGRDINPSEKAMSLQRETGTDTRASAGASPDMNFGLRVNGLQFERVYDWSSDVCQDVKRLADTGNGRKSQSGEKTTRYTRPPVDHVMSLIGTRDSTNDGTQLFTTFVKAFQNSGDDDNATALKIRRARLELGNKVDDLFNVVSGTCPTDPATSEGWCAVKEHRSGSSTITQLISGNARRFSEAATGLLAVIWGGLYWGLADFGYNPWNTVLVVIGCLFFFLFWFNIWPLGIVGFQPEGKDDTVERIGLLFLIDRLAPLAKLREDNYKISSVYKRVPEGHEGAVPFRYLRWNWWIAPAGPRDKRRLERHLIAVQVLGFVFAVFLGAAIHQLVR